MISNGRRGLAHLPAAVLAIAVFALAAAGGVAYAARTEYGTFAQAGAPADVSMAIQQVIQQSNSEQVQAIANQDASAMSDTSTPEYSRQVQGTNQQLISGGVSSIALTGIEWGPIAVSGSTATAVDYETWTTEYSDSSTLVSRDENDYALIQQDGTWLIQSDSQPNTAGGQRSARLPTPVPSTSTPAPAGAPTPASASQSSNWAGYAATGGTYTAINGTWTIPSFSPSSTAGLDATWVGIGGVNSRDLIQAGTQEQTSGSGQTQYSAWIETLPQPSQPVPLVVRPGDSIAVSLNEQSPGQWQVTLTNNTTGQNFQTSGPYRSSHSSAEWIEEAPSAGRGGIVPLDAFGSVTFTNATATKDGEQVALGDMDPQAINLSNANQQALVVVSAIGSDGQSFNATRTDVPDTQPGVRRTGRGG